MRTFVIDYRVWNTATPVNCTERVRAVSEDEARAQLVSSLASANVSFRIDRVIEVAE